MHHRTWPQLEASLLALGILCCPVAAFAGTHSLSVLLVKPLSCWPYFGGTHLEEAGARGRLDVHEKLFCGAVSVKLGLFHR